MTASPWKPGEVSADWFVSFGEPAAHVSDPSRSWLVQLSDAGLNQLQRIDDMPHLLSSAQLPVQAVRGLGMAGQLLVQAASSDPSVEAALRGSPLIAGLFRNEEMRRGDAQRSFVCL